MRTLKGKLSRIKLAAVALLGVAFAGSLTAGVATLPAVAMNISSNTVTINGGSDIYDAQTGKFNQTGLADLLSKTTGSNTYSGALSAVGSSVITSSAIYSRNGSKDVIVHFGGYDWTVTYVSKDNSGNLIATLWYADNDLTSTFSGAWRSGTQSHGYSGQVKYSNHYGGSYIRAITLGNGGYYYTAGTNTDVTLDSDVTTENADELAKDSVFYDFAQGELAGYLVSPINVSWQQDQYGYVNLSAHFQNENLVYSTAGGYTTYTNILSSQNDPLYYQWGADKIWLPSLSETGSSNTNGIWKASDNQRKSTSSTEHDWMRSGGSSVAYGACLLDNAGEYAGASTSTHMTFGVRPAVHLNLTMATGNDLWDGNGFNQDYLQDLISQMTGDDCGSYASLASALSSATNNVITAADLRALNSSNNISVKFGGSDWTVTYVSRDTNGDIIATLWYTGNDVTSTFSGSWGSGTASGGYSGQFKYSNHYGGSLLRAVTLGNGGFYYTASGTSVTKDSDVFTVATTDVQAKSSKFYDFAQGAISGFLVAPNNVLWQQDQYGYVNVSHHYQNENLKYSTEGGYASNPYIMASQNDPLYYQWGADKVWLPSLSETGNTDTNGIWQTSANQRILTSVNNSDWLRSGSYLTASYALFYALLDTSGNDYDTTSNLHNVRPAVHLNLTKACEISESDNTALENMWNEAVRQSLDNNGAQVTFTLPCNWYAQPDATYTTSFGEGIGFDKGALYIPENANIVLDLNGYTIDRCLSSAVDYGYIVYNAGTITVNDESPKATGTLTGGYSALKVGGCLVNDGTAIVNGGNFVNNYTVQGGGSAVYNRGNLTVNGGMFAGNKTLVSGAGAAITVFGTTVINGGTITNNVSASAGGAIYIDNDCELTINGGEISHNTSTVSGGGAISANVGSKITINGGIISNNSAYTYGGGIRIASGTLIINGGTISNNYTTTFGGGIYAGDSTVEMYGGVISGNTADYGGGVHIDNGASTGPSSGIFTLNGGTIKENSSTTFGGGIYVGNSTFIFNDGTFTNNKSARGGGVYIRENCTFIMNGGTISHNHSTNPGGGLYILGESVKAEINGGEICYNISDSVGGAGQTGGEVTMTGGKMYGNVSGTAGGAICVATGTFTMTGGEIYNNTATTHGGGIYLANATNLVLNGGIIKGNTASSLGGGLYLNSTGTFSVSGGEVYDNNSNGVADNVYLPSGRVLAITGALTGKGTTTYIGITMATAGAFTSGYNANNSAYDPSTFFFSDNLTYSVTKSTSNEAQLTSPAATTVSLIWEYSTDNGATWKTADTSYDSHVYSGSTYQVRAMNGSTQVQLYTAATSNSGSYTNIQGVGSYTFVINNNGTTKYSNPTFTFEITPVEIVWQYSVDGGVIWADVAEKAITYTGATYTFRAINSYTGAVVSANAGTAKAADEYEFTVSGSMYTNTSLKFIIVKSVISVSWDFKGAETDIYNNYYWNYDGIDHSPVAVLNGISNEQAGNMTLGFDYVKDGKSLGMSAPKDAGTYTVTVMLLGSNGGLLNDENIILTGDTVRFVIVPKTVTLEWFDENGESVDEAEYDYSGETHSVSAKLSGLLPGESLTPSITYEMVGGTLSGKPVNKGTYTAYASLPADSNYILDKEYSCQITINSIDLSVTWTGNAQEDGAFSWEFYGSSVNLGALCAPVPTLNGEVAGDNLTRTIEYATYDGGVAGTYGTAVPVNAGKYIARVTITDPNGNYNINGNTQEFEIKQLGITVLWKDATSGNVLTPTADGYIEWEYDGLDHNIVPYIRTVEVWYNNASGVDVTAHRADTDGVLNSVGDATAAAVLDNDPFYANFYIAGGAQQVYRVYKKVLTTATWTDFEGNEYVTGRTPAYDHGTITGATGPGFTVKTAGASGTGDILTLTVSYSVTYTGEWPVENVNGYTATAHLSAADFKNYEFDGGLDHTTLTFYIHSVSGTKTLVNVTWVVFKDDSKTDYDLADGYAFTYNGKQQFPEPIYIHDGSFEILPMSDNGKGTDADTYTVRLLPHALYDFTENDFTFTYEIAPAKATITWSDPDGNTSFKYTYNGQPQAPIPVATVSGLNCPVSVAEQTVNAGTYTAKAVVSSNFEIVSGATQDYEIIKYKFNASMIVFDYSSVNAYQNSTGGWYWIYDGDTHAPEAYIEFSRLNNLRLDFVIMGEASAIGTHTVYATLDSTNPLHANFGIEGDASSTFEIIEITIHDVYWEDAEGNVSTNGSTLLTFVYNGKPQAPEAYYFDDNNVKVPLTVQGAMTNVGGYVAWVDESLSYADGIIPRCNFVISAVKVDVEWSDNKVTYNGLVQTPTATLYDEAGNDFVGVDNKPLVLGTDYEIIGFAAAGKYTAEIRFLNNNYTYVSGTNTTNFEIERLDLNSVDIAHLVTLTWNGDADATTGTDGLYSWQYDGNEHKPALTLGFMLDGRAVVFKFSYTGSASSVGTHTLTAAITSAKWIDDNGDEIEIKENLLFVAETTYTITPFEVTIKWVFGSDATDDGQGNYYFTFDGSEHSPTAVLCDAAGNELRDSSGDLITLTVYGGEINARDAAYTARVDAPANCVFAVGETGTQEYYINCAEITVVWLAPDAEGTDTDGNFYWTFDGNAHSPKPYIANSDGTYYPLSYSGAQINAGTYTALATQGDGNYTIKSNGDCTYVIIEQEVYVKWYGVGGSETDFVWTYDGDAHAPTAVLVDKNGDVINDLNGDPISVSVTGAMTIVGSGTSHNATAVDTFTNYVFASDAVTECLFTINAKSVTEYNLRWEATGAVKSNDGTYDVYTYQYSGDAISPEPRTQNGLNFNKSIYLYNVANGTQGAAVTTIKEVGEYIIVITPVNGNYSVPADLATIRVTVTVRTATVVWSNTTLTYNGEPQAPTAYYLDAHGNEIPLDVSGAMTYAGKGYSATALFKGATPPDSYVLDNETTTFDIEQLEIPVSWLWTSEWNNKTVTYDTLAHTPLPQVDSSVVLNADKTKLQFYYEITKTGMQTVTNATVKDAGAYTITLKIDGSAAGNYKIESGKESEQFTIYQKKLTVTAASFTVSYGQNAPAYTATFVGFAGTEDETNLGLLAVQASWLKCAYINRSVPGTYAIGLVYSELARLLPNYDITTTDGVLTVDPADRVVIWSGDNSDLSTYYNGSEYKPYAYYFDGNPNNPIELKVVYATYDENTGEFTEITDVDYKAINAGTYYVIAKTSSGNVALANAEISYEILKREIVVNIDSKTTKYGEPYKTLTWSYDAAGLRPLAGDELNIQLSSVVFDESRYVNGYMNAGEYQIIATWDSATFGSNYNVVFVGEGEDSATGANTVGLYTIALAEISVTKASEIYSDEEFTSIRELDTQGVGIQIKLGNTYTDDDGVTQYTFINYSGYRNAANVTVYYSRVFNIGSIEDGLLSYPDPHDGVVDDKVVIGTGINQYQTYREVIRDVGCYAINYIIFIDNHEPLYGTWTVLMLPESQVVRVEFVKDYEVEYGKDVPENLAEELLRGGYVSINIAEERFLQYATAHVMDGKGGYVSGKTGVGKYTVEIEVENTNSNTQLLVTYHSDFGAEDTNVGRYVIQPRKLTVDWGTVEFDHDGTVKMPAPSLYGWVTADALALTEIKIKSSGDAYEYTAYVVNDNGANVTVIVSAKGNFTDIGGHTLIVTVEDSNYTIDILNGNATVSIVGEEVNVVENTGWPDWLIYLLIAAGVLLLILILIIIIVVKKKRAALEDNEGFYDNVEVDNE